MADEDGKQTVEEQIDDMLKIGEEKLVEPPVEEPPVEDPPVEDPLVEEPPVEEPPVEPPEDPPTKPPEEPKDEIDLEQLQKDNEELRKRIDDMSTPKPEPEPEKPEPEPEPVKLDEVDFIGDADMDELTRDPKEFNKLLNKIYVQGVNASKQNLSEGVLRSIPDIVKSNVATVINLRKASEDFYENNEDLVPFKKVVAAVFEEVAAENPDRKFDEILTDVGTEVRKRLELHLKAVEPKPKPDPKDNPPRLPRKKGQPGKPASQPNLNPLLAEIDEMNKLTY